MSARFIPAVESPYLVPFDGSFRVADAPTRPPKGDRAKRSAASARSGARQGDRAKRSAASARSGARQGDRKQKAVHNEALQAITSSMRELQRRLYADDRWALLLVFQAMDAAGKDGTIRAVMTGVNPAGCQVYSFKAPSAEELDHDFLWRIAQRLPERGRIGIFNRSHYEEVLAVRVHPEYLAAQKLPAQPDLEDLWEERYQSIRNFERHLARNGTVVVKFWLNVSREEQKERLLARIDEPDSHWKFSAKDVEERGHWADYMRAYEDALNATSRPWAPWYAIPADEKPFMRRTVADIVLRTLERMEPRFPAPSRENVERMKALRAALAGERE